MEEQLQRNVHSVRTSFGEWVWRLTIAIGLSLLYAALCLSAVVFVFYHCEQNSVELREKYQILNNSEKDLQNRINELEKSNIESIRNMNSHRNRINGIEKKLRSIKGLEPGFNEGNN